MRTKSRHFSEKSASEMLTLKSSSAHTTTEIVETDSELSSYAHCRLPDHYFDMLLAKSQQRMAVPPPQIEQSGLMYYR